MLSDLIPGLPVYFLLFCAAVGTVIIVGAKGREELRAAAAVDPPTPGREVSQVAIAVLVLAAVVALVAGYYFLAYDTAEARCSRGDLGACLVLSTDPPADH